VCSTFPASLRRSTISPQANSTNAALTAEVQRLQAALEEVSVRFAEACDSSNVLTASLADVKLSAESMRLRKTVKFVASCCTNVFTNLMLRAERDALENALADAQAQCAETKQVCGAFLSFCYVSVTKLHDDSFTLFVRDLFLLLRIYVETTYQQSKLTITTNQEHLHNHYIKQHA